MSWSGYTNHDWGTEYEGDARCDMSRAPASAPQKTEDQGECEPPGAELRYGEDVRDTMGIDDRRALREERGRVGKGARGAPLIDWPRPRIFAAGSRS